MFTAMLETRSLFLKLKRPVGLGPEASASEAATPRFSELYQAMFPIP